MARKAQYTKALPVYVKQPIKDRIEAVATNEDISMAQVIREIIDEGIEAREKRGQS
jgi:predicted DNA-binding protein